MFDNVGVVIFIASLSEYNEKLFEDSNINAMDEALDLFRSTINNEWFRDKPVILLLNKMDLFAEKLSVSYCYLF